MNMKTENRAGPDNSAFNAQRFADLCRLAMGGRSILQFAKECGLSQSFLSRALNQQLPSRPSRRTLMKLTDPATARPSNNVTLKDVMTAVGYDPVEPLPEVEPIIENEPEQSESIALWQSIADYFGPVSHTKAMSMLVDALIYRGVDKNMMICMHPGFFEVAVRNTQDKYVGISAFCQERSAIGIMKHALMQIFTSVRSVTKDRADAGNAIYYILTDQAELFEAFSSGEFPGFQGKGLAVLYAEDDTRFTREYWVTPKKPTENIFPVSLITDGSPAVSGQVQ